MKSTLKGPAIAAVMATMFAGAADVAGHVAQHGAQVTLADGSCQGKCGADKKKAPKEPKAPKAPEFNVIG